MIWAWMAVAQAVGPGKSHVVYTADVQQVPERKLLKEVGEFEAVPWSDLVVIPSRGATLEDLKMAVAEAERDEAQRDKTGWLKERRRLEELRRSRPAALKSGGELRVRLEALILRAAEGSEDAGGVFEAERTLAQMIALEPELLAVFPEPTQHARMAALAESAGDAPRHRVTVGPLQEVRWEGLTLPVKDGVVELSQGQWDLVGLRDGSPSWAMRIQVGSEVDVARVLEERVAEVDEMLETKACSVDLPRWIAREGHVWRGKTLWRLTDTGATQTSRRCSD